jgi:hypothetical protein
MNYPAANNKVSIEIDHISGKKTPHIPGQGLLAGSH